MIISSNFFINDICSFIFFLYNIKDLTIFFLTISLLEKLQEFWYTYFCIDFVLKMSNKKETFSRISIIYFSLTYFNNWAKGVWKVITYFIILNYKTETMFHGRKLHVELSLLFNNVLFCSVVHFFTLRNTQRWNLCSSLAFVWELSTTFHYMQQSFNQQSQPFIFALLCYRWWKMGVAC